jgi:hypothetical protein
MPTDPYLDIALEPGAEHNGLAVMLADLLKQNLADKPNKRRDFEKMVGDVAIVAEDADIALTLRFNRGRLRIADGIVGIPALTVRATAEVVMALSDMPIFLGLPLPPPGDDKALAALRGVLRAMGQGDLHTYGMLTSPRLMLQVTRVMSVNG